MNLWENFFLDNHGMQLQFWLVAANTHYIQYMAVAPFIVQCEDVGE